MTNYLKVRDVEHLKKLCENKELLFFDSEDPMIRPIGITFSNNLFKIVDGMFKAKVDEKGLIKQTKIGEAIESGNLYMY